MNSTVFIGNVNLGYSCNGASPLIDESDWIHVLNSLVVDAGASSIRYF